MLQSQLIEAANRLLAHQPWRNPGQCYQLAERLREAGELELAERLQEAAHSRPTWPGSTARG